MLREHLRVFPGDPAALRLLAMIAGAHGQNEDAAGYLAQALLASPDDVELHYMAGNVLSELRRYPAAAEHYRKCLTVDPLHSDAADGLGRCLISTDHFEEGMSVYQRAINARPDSPLPRINHLNVLIRLGRMPDVLNACMDALNVFPSHPIFLEHAAIAMNYFAAPPTMHRAMHERLGAVYAAASRRSPVAFTPDAVPARPLRVGFLSGDFGNHVCAMFLSPLLTNFNPASVRATCFSTRPADGHEGPFRACCAWRDVSGMDDDALASAIVSERIDILVECSGLTDGQRLSALVPRVAPIQCTWLGYPNTTGLPTMDFRIVDSNTDPPGSESHCTEKIARLDTCFLCWRPSPLAPRPEPSRSMRDPGAPVIFGSFNRLSKLSPETVETWCRVLNAVPDSRLLVKVQAMSAQLYDALRNQFTLHGLDPARIDVAPWARAAGEHARMYCLIDIALDAFPYNGTTTTCEAAWMGVPTVALAGDTHRARVGVTINTALGLPELIAADATQYVQIASDLANDRARLRTLKLGMRDRMKRSALRDEKTYAREWEHLLHELWKRHRPA